MSLPLHDDQQDALRTFAARVASSPHNLVSRRARSELEERHVPECLALAELLPAGAHRLLDVGSGGGFPGLVVAIARPELEVHLLDSTAKKTAFLRETAEQLGVDVTVHTGRAEDLARTDLAASFPLVTARAVAPLERLLGWTVPFLTVGGTLYALKGERWRAELDAASGELRRQGAQVVATPNDHPQLPSTPTGVSPRVVIITRAR